MDNDLLEEQQVPSALLIGIKFDVSTEEDMEKISVMKIDAVNEITDPKLGVPNPSYQCSTCGAKDTKKCEGHFGVIKFPFTILHPYFLTEVVQILNKICPGCKSIRQGQWVKGANSGSRRLHSNGCKYCDANSNDWYPTMKFKVSSKDLFRKTAIIVEMNEKLPKKLQRKSFGAVLPLDYWNFIPKDPQQEENCLNPNRRVLSHAQVHYLLKDIDPRFIKEFVSRMDSFFLNCLPVTPNNHRVMEITHALSNGQTLIFDQHSRAYKKLVDFRGTANELSCRVLDCLKTSKLHSEKSSKDSASKMSGLKWIKEVLLGKRTNHSFRMIVVGDPKLRLSEIGIPCHIAEELLISEHLNSWNWEKLTNGCNLRLLEKGQIYVRRKGTLAPVRRMNDFQTGDIIYRPLTDGDIVLINRPPSIHQHSLIALSVKVLPLNSVVSINPLCCSPFRGDFDGDCLHGYIPQSVDSRVELSELVALNRQLINRQSGRNLLSLSQDSLSATHLVMEDGVLLNLFQMQQLEMFCPYQLQSPAIIKAPLLDTQVWIGKQLFSMLLPPGFNYVFPLNGVCIRDGELISSSDGSAWLRDIDGNLFSSLVKHCQGKALDFLYAAQEVLCEWLSMRGLSVSLSDIYLSSDSISRKNMIDEVFSGLLEAEQTCHFKQLLVDSSRNFLVGSGDKNQNGVVPDVQSLWYERQRSAALGQSSVCAFKQVFRDIQSLVYRYASKDNSLLAMVKAGSKGNLLKLVQQGLCLGLQHSLVPLSFKIPHQLSCAAWNKQKMPGLIQNDTSEYAKSYIPYAVVENSFLMGLNPLECFVHSVTSRDSSFSDNADLPGTLTRRLMFFMRDLYIAYDGTVRNAYGNQLVQFSYNIEHTSIPSDGVNEDTCAYDMGGQPVGSMSACAISEAAYSALDQPISLLEPSPLLNLKRVLECGLRKSTANRTVSLFLSKKLEKRRHGFEYGALEVKNHLEKLLFSDIVSTVMIVFSPQNGSQTHFSPWVCHFHVFEEIAKKRSLKPHLIIDALYMKCNSARAESKINLPDLQITSNGRDCFVDTEKEDSDWFCITVSIVNSKKSCIQLDTVRDLVIPFLLGAVVKGLLDVKKVDILWNDHPDSDVLKSSSGELYLRVSISGDCGKKNFWGALMNACLQIMDMIDWERSHPDNIHDIFLVYGIDAGWKYFLNSLKSAISDIGKTVLPEHLVLVASCLSATGEFVGLNAKGMAQQKELTSISSPFMQACFSNPGACFIKAGKRAVVDDLHGSLDALAWGKIPSIGSGGHFDILYSGKGHGLARPEDIYKLLGSQTSCHEQNVKFKVPITRYQTTNKCGAQLVYANGDSASKGCKNLGKISKSVLRSFLSLNDIQKLSRRLKFILQKYPINHQLSEIDKTTLMMALYFHPRRDEKIGPGAQNIKDKGKSAMPQNWKSNGLKQSDSTKEPYIGSLRNLLLYYPGCISVDESGNRLFLSDSNHHRIIIFTGNGKILDCIGSAPGFEDGEFESAKLARPAASFYHAAEDCLYFVDSENHAIRRADMGTRVLETFYPPCNTNKKENGLWSWIVNKLGMEKDVDTKPAEFDSGSLMFPWHLMKSMDDDLFIINRSFETLWIMALASGEIKEEVRGIPKVLEICGEMIMEKLSVLNKMPHDWLQQQVDSNFSLEGNPYAGLMSSLATFQDDIVVCDTVAQKILRLNGESGDFTNLEFSNFGILGLPYWFSFPLERVYVVGDIIRGANADHFQSFTLLPGRVNIQLMVEIPEDTELVEPLQDGCIWRLVRGAAAEVSGAEDLVESSKEVGVAQQWYDELDNLAFLTPEPESNEETTTLDTPFQEEKVHIDCAVTTSPGTSEVIIYAALYLKLKRNPNSEERNPEKNAARIVDIWEPEKSGRITRESCIQFLSKQNEDLEDLIFMKHLHVRIGLESLSHPKADNSKGVIVSDTSIQVNVSL